MAIKEFDCVIIDTKEKTFTILDGSVGTYKIEEIEKIQVLGEKASKKLANKKGHYGIMIALMLFVGIPLPGTGAWTGTLGASFLNLDLKTTTASVMSGIIIAGIIMATVSVLGLHIFGL